MLTVIPFLIWKRLNLLVMEIKIMFWTKWGTLQSKVYHVYKISGKVTCSICVCIEIKWPWTNQNDLTRMPELIGLCVECGQFWVLVVLKKVITVQVPHCEEVISSLSLKVPFNASEYIKKLHIVLDSDFFHWWWWREGGLGMSGIHRILFLPRECFSWGWWCLTFHTEDCGGGRLLAPAAERSA